MGSERKSKEEKKKIRKRSPTPESEDERRSKKQRSEKKEKGKDKKSQKHRSDKEKKSKDKHRDKHSKRDHHYNLEFQELTKDDYFSKNNEFATWLIEEKKVFFSDLSSDSAREYFLDFIKAWNKQKLDSRYYKGISSGLRSAHNWKLKLPLPYIFLPQILRRCLVFCGGEKLQWDGSCDVDMGPSNQSKQHIHWENMWHTGCTLLVCFDWTVSYLHHWDRPIEVFLFVVSSKCI